MATREGRKSQGCVPDNILDFSGLAQLKDAAASTFQLANVTEQNIVERLLETATLYEETSKQLQASAARPGPGISGQEQFPALARDYAERAKKMREVLQMFHEAGLSHA
mmetsp:Transcript_18742/g.28182  ORF Transcript_18742/g.28182 Transcript_18742/m.28182 type:complete len:109 (-) Transcript_18742:355-681(-)